MVNRCTQTVIESPVHTVIHGKALLLAPWGSLLHGVLIFWHIGFSKRICWEPRSSRTLPDQTTRS